ncbi:PREDICTED: THO complex subunit 5 homolog isoform X4 [Branchiostoma belcheri]|uniref:THO complex subunit 5 homolog isoform X3 n=1 Tax=Branchiostoma belcheri TaxID=7741 RepID=A0A6P4Y5R7_BRABE|nr:PREDICTED: THO complex subunit 5 homolog isoform X3 [Branchiostoma belcheri]XP_019619783.1 PREDICTED: THO complex subunit 5 homolog isoform X4 [Branchiostoma belcheri]
MASSAGKKRPMVRVSRTDSSSNLTDKDSKKPKMDSGDRQGESASLYSEEEEAAQRDPAKDVSLYKTACDGIRQLLQEIQDIRGSGRKDAAAEIAERKIQASMHFITLKKLNRLAHMRCKKARDTTHEHKQKVDSYHLQLQNLLYEVLHLQKEITKCLEFKSKDEEIELVDEAEFYKEAPEDISKPDVTQQDPHQLTLARLDWELEQRKRLAAKCKDYEDQKEEISQEIQTRRDQLDSLLPRLNTVLESTKPLQEALKMPFDEMRQQHRMAQFLPRPLYVLYVQSSAYQQACDPALTVTIEGDLDAAKSSGPSTSAALDVDSDSDDEEGTKEKSRRRRTISVDPTDRRGKVLHKHPLQVNITIKCKDGSSLALTFHYLLALQVVTVIVQLQPAAEAVTVSISGGDLLSPSSLLSCLFPGDHGNTTPNPANQFLLERASIEDFNECVKEVGKPYVWAQQLAGLQFLNTEEPPKPDTHLSSTHMEKTMKALKVRVRARLALVQQLASLERGSVPVNRECQHLFPTKITSRLTTWKSITYDDYIVLPYSQPVVDSGMVHETDNFYLAVVQRGSATLTAAVLLSPGYLTCPPVFSLNLNMGTDRTASCDENIRAMEHEVNVHYKELLVKGSHDQLLTNQLQRLLMCLDVYLETQSTSSATEGPSEFGREKICPRVVRGPSRCKPFVFNSQHGFFTQR